MPCPKRILARRMPRLLRSRLALLATCTIFALTNLSGCRSKQATQAPEEERGELVDDIDALERHLSANEARLGNAGIRVAQAPRDTATPSTPGVREAPPSPWPNNGQDTQRSDPDLTDAELPAPSAPARTASKTSADQASAPDLESESFWTRRKRQRAQKKQRATRCERVCDLAVATCELAHRICELADAHEDEVRYAQACERAAHQCQAAAQACRVCEG